MSSVCKATQSLVCAHVHVTHVSTCVHWQGRLFSRLFRCHLLSGRSWWHFALCHILLYSLQIICIYLIFIIDRQETLKIRIGYREANLVEKQVKLIVFLSIKNWADMDSRSRSERLLQIHQGLKLFGIHPTKDVYLGLYFKIWMPWDTIFKLISHILLPLCLCLFLFLSLRYTESVSLIPFNLSNTSSMSLQPSSQKKAHCLFSSWREMLI